MRPGRDARRDHRFGLERRSRAFDGHASATRFWSPSRASP